MSKKSEQLEWRRNKVDELSIKGFSLTEISRMLEIPKSTIFRDIELLKDEARETIKNHFQDKLPYEYNKCLKGLEEIIKELWIIATQADKKGDTREKLQSLALIKDTYNTKMDLLTNASLLQDAIKYVEQHTKDKLVVVEEGNGLEGSTEDNNSEIFRSKSDQYNQAF